MHRIGIAGWLLLCLPWTACVYGQELAEPAERLVGDRFTYVVQPKDILLTIGGRFGVDVMTLARSNRLKLGSRLLPGQVLQIDNRHIVPERMDDGMLINIPQRMLFHFQGGKLIGQYPVGLGRPDWPTATGAFRVAEMRENPVWRVPKSIQAEMRAEGKVVKARVPPGPDNPLGQYWIGLSIAGFGIHGTIAPASIYRFQSHGCIRLHSPASG